MEHVINITPSGAVKAMHLDSFPLGFLGAQRIERASDIRFGEGTQTWGIWFRIDDTYITPSEVYGGFNSYEEARAFEVAVMNEAMKQQTFPLQTAVQKWARAYRACPEVLPTENR